MASGLYATRLDIVVRRLIATPGEEGAHLENVGPRNQLDFDLRLLVRRQLRREKPSIGGRRMRLNTAKDEKISSRSMFWLMGAGRAREMVGMMG